MPQTSRILFGIIVSIFFPLIVLGVALVLWSSYASHPARAISTTVAISEFRTRGPNGVNDEFIELFNLTEQPIDIGGWKIRKSNSGGGGVADRMIILTGTIIPARGYFLAANSVGYNGLITPTQTYTEDIPNNGGIALTLPNNAVIDAVGMSPTSFYRESTTLAPLGSNSDQSYERRPGGIVGSNQDTDDNANDFQLISPSDPKNLDSIPACYPTRTVSDSGDSGPGTLRLALSQVCQGGIIDFAASLANQTIVLTSAELVITKSVTITNPNAPNLSISGNNAQRIFNIQGVTVELDNLNLISGSVTGGTGCPDFCGGAILTSSGANVAINNNTFTGNVAISRGGAIYNQGTLTINNNTFNTNAAGRGGAIFNRSNLTINNSSFNGNLAGNSGGGIHNQDTLTINNSTLSNNQANQVGGGLFNDSGSSLTINNSTISTNGANQEGGGLYNSNATSQLTLNNSTISNNRATTFGGGIRNLGNLRFRNTIVANSVSGGDCISLGTGNIISFNSYNLVEDGSCNSPGAVAFLTGDPNLGPLQNNGGSTLTHLLRKPSPAINSGDNTNAPTFDQRGPGFPRVLENLIDLGAAEYSPPCAITVTNTNDSGPNSLRQALVDVCDGGTVDFDPSLADQTILLTSTELVITKTVTITNPFAPNLKISGNNAHRIFQVQDGAALTLGYLSLISGTVTGGVGCPVFCGGAILVNSQASLTVNNSILNGNNSSNQGGAIYSQGILAINNSTMSSNSASNVGGAVANLGTMTVSYSLFSANSANQGGGIFNQMALTVNNSTFDRNPVQDAGGGIYNQLSLTVNSSTFSGNSSNNLGGGIYNRGTLTLNHSTLSDNSAVRGGGGIRNFGALNYRNTIIANSSLGGDCVTSGGGTIGTNIANLVENRSCSAAFSGDPNLGPLQNNGGPTPTRALRNPSPAINVGNNSGAPSFDQRGPGFPRIVDGRIDLGAVEFTLRPGLSLNPISLNVSEGGSPATYSVSLLTQPTAPVTVNLTTTGQVEVSPNQLHFDSLNWESIQQVSVTPVDDSVIEGTHTNEIQHAALSSDSNYHHLTGTVTIFINDNDPVAEPPPSAVYLPMLLNEFGQAPDLVVDNLTAGNNTVIVVIKNIGNAPATDAFWVDVYLNPSTTPTQVNQVWQDLSSQGLVWGVTTSIPVDGTLTLTLGDAYYRPDFSNFEGVLTASTPAYAQVDSVNLQTNYGGVLENHEIKGGAYNNISGPVLATAGTASAAAPGTTSTLTPNVSGQLPTR
jgi:predicted outer membrane repeat protein